MGDTLQTINEIDRLEIAHSFECDTLNLHNYLNIKKNDFTLATQNIRSIYCNFDSFILSLSNLKFEADVIVLTECRLDSNKHIPQLPNYNMYSSTHQLNQNDGVVVYVKNSLRHKVNEIKLLHASCLQVQVLNNTILCIYRSPSNANAEPFIYSLNNHITSIKSTNKNIIITGDININIKLKTDERTQERNNRLQYLDMLSLNGILAAHTLPTREENCLDHIMLRINSSKCQASVGVLHTTITDHFTVLLCISKIKINACLNKTKTLIDFDSALEDLKQKNLEYILYTTNPNEVLDRLTYELTTVLSKNKTIKTIPKQYRNIKPWITQGILRCIRNRDNLQKQLKNDPFNEILKITYKRYRNTCNKLIKKQKRNYERELLSKSYKNNKLLWKNIKYITYSNKNHSTNSELLYIKSTPTDSADYINRYFANIGKQLATNIKPDSNVQKSYLTNLPSQPNSFILSHTDHAEVNAIISSLKSNSAPGWDNIPNNFLKLAKPVVIPIVTHLVNLCFDKGIFPAPLKQSIITPIYKNGDRDDVNNYRPISVLPAISKILEKLLNNRLLNYFNKFNLLSQSQYGFRSGKSTEDAVSALTSLIVEHLDKGSKCLSVFLDIKKAFDTVSVPILLHKLERMGIRGIPLRLLQDYLTKRKQRVKLGDHSCTSEDEDVTYGVPQGSVLGPTLFLAYINDLCDMKIPLAKIFSYADDTAIVFTGTSWEDTQKITETGLEMVNVWLRNNILTLNTTKTNYICHSLYSNTQPQASFNIKIHSCCNNVLNCCQQTCPTILKVDSTKYLGVFVDRGLSWYQHLEYVILRLRKLNWIFKNLRHVVPRDIPCPQGHKRNLLKEIYISLVQSVLTYCLPIWGGAAKTRFIDVERAQRSLLKIMYFKKMWFSTDKLYQLCNLLSVRKLYIRNCVLRKHKTTAFDCNLLSKRRRDIVMQVPKTHTTFACRQYIKQSSHIYNTLNKELDIYSKPLYDVNKKITTWLEYKNYDQVEDLLRYIV
jgi:hypothetical protein